MANIVYVAFASGDVQPWDVNGVNPLKQKDIDERRRKVSNLSLTIPYL